MMELEAVELAIQISYSLTVHRHLLVHAVFVLHDLIHDQLRVTPDLEAFDLELDSDSEMLIRASY
jgi:23S rRNA maturation-related 3'-5' exoribonuclease YhaM